MITEKLLFVGLPLLICGCCSNEVAYGRSSIDPHPLDSDNDLLTDFEEEVFTGTDPYKADTDGDGLPDGWEWFSGLDPLCPDGSDGPGGDPYDEGVTNIEKFRANPDKYKNRGMVYEDPAGKPADSFGRKDGVD